MKPGRRYNAKNAPAYAPRSIPRQRGIGNVLCRPIADEENDGRHRCFYRQWIGNEGSCLNE